MVPIIDHKERIARLEAEYLRLEALSNAAFQAESDFRGAPDDPRGIALIKNARKAHKATRKAFKESQKAFQEYLEDDDAEDIDFVECQHIAVGEH